MTKLFRRIAALSVVLLFIGVFQTLTITPALADTPDGLPLAPSSVWAKAIDGNSVQVSWSPPSNPGNSAITSYTATANPGGVSCTEPARPNADVYTCDLVNATQTGDSVDITVTATNDQGTSVPSDSNAGALAVYTPVENDQNFTCWITSSHKVDCQGNGWNSRTDVPSDLGTVIKLAMTAWGVCALKTDHTVACWGGWEITNIPTDLGTVSDIAGGFAGVCAIKLDGSVACWGVPDYFNNVSQAVPTLSNAASIYVGTRSACAILQDQSVSCWGEARASAVPAGIQATQISIGDYFGCAVNTNHRAICWGYSAPNPPSSWTSVQSVTVDNSQLCELTLDGTLSCINRYAGWVTESHPDGVGAADAVTLQSYWFCLHLVAGGIYCLGNNDRLRLNGYSEARRLGTHITVGTAPTSPTNVAVIHSNQSISVTWEPPTSAGGLALTTYRVLLSYPGSHTLCVVPSTAAQLSCTFNNLGNGIAYQVNVWAYNSVGRSAPAAALPFVKIAMNNGEFACGLGQNHRIQCWAANTNYPILRVPADFPDAKDIAITANGVGCAILMNNTIKCWGSGPGSAGLAGLSDVSKISGGQEYFCAIHHGGQVACWGNDNWGMATPPDGITDAIDISTSQWETCIAHATGSIECWGYQDFSATTADVTGAVRVFSNNWTTCVLLADNSIECLSPWSALARTAINGYTKALDMSFANDGSRCIVTMAGAVSCDGNNEWGKVTPPPGLEKIKQVAIANNALSCALSSAGDITCWGYNGDDRFYPPISGFDANPGQKPDPVVSVSAEAGARGTLLRANLGNMYGHPATSVHYVVNPGNKTCDVDTTKQTGRVECVIMGLTSGSDYTVSATVTSDLGTSDPTLFSNAQVKQFTHYGLGCFVTLANEIKCDTSDSYIQRQIPTGLGEVKKIMSTWNEACAQFVSGQFRCWGYDWGAVESFPSDTANIRDFALAGYTLCIAFQDGSVQCFGNNDYGRKNVPSGLSDVTELDSSYWGICAIQSDQSVSCWGTSQFPSSSYPAATKVAFSERFACAINLQQTIDCYRGGNQMDIFGDMTGVTDVVVFQYTICAENITEMRCWTENSDGYKVMPALTNLSKFDDNSGMCGLTETQHAVCRYTNGTQINSLVPAEFREIDSFTAAHAPVSPVVTSIAWTGDHVVANFNASTDSGDGTGISYYRFLDLDTGTDCYTSQSIPGHSGKYSCALDLDATVEHNLQVIAVSRNNLTSPYITTTVLSDDPFVGAKQTLKIATSDRLPIDVTVDSPDVCSIPSNGLYVGYDNEYQMSVPITYLQSGTCSISLSGVGYQTVHRSFQILANHGGNGVYTRVYKNWDGQNFTIEDASKLCGSGEEANFYFADNWNRTYPLNKFDCGADYFRMEKMAYIKWPGVYDGVTTTAVKFYAVTDDVQALFVDGREIFSPAIGGTSQVTASINELAGSLVPITFWLGEYGGYAYSQLYWNASHPDSDPQETDGDAIKQADLFFGTDNTKGHPVIKWSYEMRHPSQPRYWGDRVNLDIVSTVAGGHFIYSLSQDSDCTLGDGYVDLTVKYGHCTVTASVVADDFYDASNEITINIPYTRGQALSYNIDEQPQLFTNYELGQTLGSQQFVGGRVTDQNGGSVAGAWSFDDPTLVAQRAGDWRVQVTFTPFNLHRYTVSHVEYWAWVNESDSYDINDWPSQCSEMNAGEPLNNCALDGGDATTSGVFAFLDGDTKLATGDENWVEIIFIPDNPGMSIAYGPWHTIMGIKQDPVVNTWPSVGASQRGAFLYQTELRGGSASVPGYFSWVNYWDTSYGDGSQRDIQFIPYDQDSYNIVTGTGVGVTHIGIAPTIVSPTAADLIYGHPRSEATISFGAGTTPGRGEYTQPDQLTNNGSTNYEYRFYPSDLDTYYAVFGNVHINVSPAPLDLEFDPTISQANTGYVLWGVGIYDGGFRFGENYVGGYWSWDNPDDRVTEGSHLYAATFHPDDTSRFQPYSAQFEIVGHYGPAQYLQAPVSTPLDHGQSLASSTLSGGLSNVPGTFSWADASVVPADGDSYQQVIFTPDDLTQADVVQIAVWVYSQRIRLQPVATDPPYTCRNYYGHLLSEFCLYWGGAKYDGNYIGGHYEWVNPNVVVHHSNVVQEVRFIPDDSQNYAPATTTVTLNPIAGSTSIWIEPTVGSNLNYGDTLGSLSFRWNSSWASVPGAWSWETPDLVPSAGQHVANLTFVPTDQDAYNSVTRQLTYTVNQVTPTVGGTLGFGEMTPLHHLSDYSLSDLTASAGSQSVAGSFAWVNANQLVTPGVHVYQYRFTPTDSTNVAAVTTSYATTVAQLIPAISTSPSATAIDSDQTLFNSTLYGGSASVPGTFTWTNIHDSISVGTSNHSVTFTPTDTTNYSTVTLDVTVVVNSLNVSQSVLDTAPTASGLNYGTALSNATLHNGAAVFNGSVVLGHFEWVHPTTVIWANNTVQSAVFVPTDSRHYLGFTVDVTVTGYRTAPSVSAWPIAADIIYGQALSDSRLANGHAQVSGTWDFTFDIPDLEVGTSAVSVTFTPDDLENYQPVSHDVNIGVLKVPVWIESVPNVPLLAPLHTYSDYEITGGAVVSHYGDVTGTWHWAQPDSAVVPNTSLHGYYFVPDDSTHFGTVSTNSIQFIAKLTPTITVDPTLSPIEVGQHYYDTELSGGEASVPGEFGVYYLNEWAVAGSRDMVAYFCPNDTVNYSCLDFNLTVQVNQPSTRQAELGMPPVANALHYGQFISDSHLSLGTALVDGTLVDGTFEWDNPDDVLTVDNRIQSVRFYPTDNTHYLGFSTMVTISASKITPVVSHTVSVASITFGEDLSHASITPGIVDVPGTWSWVDSSATPNAGSTSQSIQFVPEDTDTYETITTSVNVTTQKASTTSTGDPTVSGTAVYGKKVSDLTLSAGTASVDGTFAWHNGNQALVVGTNDYVVDFTPTQSGNYNGFSMTVTITAAKANPTFTGTLASRTFVYGQKLNTATLAGSTANVSGSWAWELDAATPDVGQTSANAVFTPTDSDNYNSAVVPVTISVSKAVPSLVTAPTAATLGFSQPLSASVLNGGVAKVGQDVIAGTFVWHSPTTTTQIGTSTQAIDFVPTDTAHYQGFAAGTISLVTGKGAPVSRVLPVFALVKPGVKLSTLKITGGTMSAAGKFAWASPNTVVTAANAVQNLTFTPTDTTHYQAVSVPITLQFMTAPASPRPDPVAPAAYPKAKSTVFKWVAPTSNGGSPITKYEYCMAACDLAKNWKTTALKTTVTVAGIKIGVSGTVQVRATNAVGSSSAISISYTQAK